MSAAALQSTAASVFRAKVMIVDDEPTVCSVLVSVLTNLGYDPVASADPRAALRMIESGGARPDVLITDFVMPHMSGLELIHRGKAFLPALKTILASGEVEQPDVSAGVQPDAYLEKPFSTQALAAALKSLLEESPDSGGKTP
jgi:CheY-like chemotaxis protein